MRTLISLFVAISFSSTALASVELDQDFYFPSQTNILSALTGTIPDLPVAVYSNGVAQTFTVGTNGILDAVEIYVPSEYGASSVDPRAEPTLLRILATENGVPIGGASGSVVLAESISVVSIGANRRFDLRNQNLDVEVGDTFAIQAFGLTGDLGTAGLWGGIRSLDTDPYAGGNAFGYSVVSERGPFSFPIIETPEWTTRTNDDLFFRTYVDTSPQPVAVPEPSSIFAFSLVFLAPLWKLRRTLRTT